jgi:hypothetical protein
MTTLICQNCGAEWKTSDTTERDHFEPVVGNPDITSPFLISLSGEPMEHCPKCPLPVDEMMREGDRTVPDLHRDDG